MTWSSAGPSGLVVDRRVVTSIDELVDPHVTARTAPMALRPGVIRAELVRADLGPVKVEVCDYSFPIATRGESLPEVVTLLAPLHAAGGGHLNGHALAPGVLHVFAGAAEIAGATVGPLQFGIATFARDALDETARLLDLDLVVPDPGQFRTARAVGWSRLLELLGAIRGASDDPSARAAGRPDATALAEMLLDLAVRTVSTESDRRVLVPRTQLTSLRIVRSCERHATRRRYQDVTLADLCEASGVSERRVRHAFYECYGMSPTAYLRVVALHRVRDALLDGPPVRDPVTRAASEFGFWHLGRFAAQYRALFGEPPAMTVERRTRTAAS